MQQSTGGDDSCKNSAGVGNGNQSASGIIDKAKSHKAGATAVDAC